jgi:DNA repair protein RadC
VADPKRIFKLALENNAASIILGHNHPSGNLRPSESDIKLTKKIREAGLLLEINVLDHIIVGIEKYFSFADEGLI